MKVKVKVKMNILPTNRIFRLVPLLSTLLTLSPILIWIVDLLGILFGSGGTNASSSFLLPLQPMMLMRDVRC